MPLVRSDAVLSVRISSKRLPRPMVDAARNGANRLLGLQSFNNVYRRLPLCEPTDIARVFLNEINVRTALDGEPLDTIPAAGPLITIANHPFGFVDGMAICATLFTIRPDVTIMLNHMLSSIPEFAARCIFVGSPARRSPQKHSLRGWRETFQWISRGGAMVVFPAGRVSTFHWRRMAVADRFWSPHIAALAKRTGAPVLPIFVHGRNSLGFQLACKLCPPMQDLMIVGEVTNKRGTTLRLTVGRLIQPHELSRFATDEEATLFLRQRTDALAL